jgi:hypothetical protein
MRERGCAGVNVTTGCDIRGVGAVVRSVAVKLWARQGASEFRSQKVHFSSLGQDMNCPGRVFFPVIFRESALINTPKLCHDCLLSHYFQAIVHQLEIV